MQLSFVYGRYQYQAVEVSGSLVSKKVVCVDSVFYNEHAPTRSRFMEPPQGTRSAHQRMTYPEFMTSKNLEEASRFLDCLAECTDGFFLPNITHRWHSRIHAMMAQHKLIYTTLTHQRGKLYKLVRYPL